MKNRKKREEGGAKWMDTYGDMVTLLLCFFVMLYSISSVDQNKFNALVASLNPSVMEEMEEASQAAQGSGTGTGEGEGTETGGQVSGTEAFETIYQNLVAMSEELGIQGQADIYQGDGYTFISFRDQVFFDGDSSVLKPEGQTVLDSFCEAIAPAADSIKELEVLGHTSQGDPNIPNEVVTDRVLSAERSAQVVAYIQEKDIISPEKLISCAYGQWRPIASFDTTEDRAKNRRAEILITKDGSVERSLEEYYQQIYGDLPDASDEDT